MKIAHLPYCFDQLPVLVQNETWFLTPKTHILTRKARQIDCNGIIPAYYKINNNWIKFLPKPTNAESPRVVRPNTEIEWIYKNIESLATSGVYSREDSKKLHENLIFPIEKSALLNTIARQMTNEEDFQGDAIKGLLTDNKIWHIITKGWNIIWAVLTSWGSVSSGIIMLVIIGQAIKLVFDAIIRGCTLHAVYGFSIYKLAAVSNSITHLFVQLWNRKRANRGMTTNSTKSKF